MSGGTGNPVSRAIGSIDSAINGRSNNNSMPAYGSKTVSPSANRYTPTYTPMQQNLQQSPMQQAPQQTIQNMGLEALYQSMANQFAPISQQQNLMDQFYQQPTQRQMPTYQNPALNYRPDMSGITANLNRVAPGVTDQQMHPEQYAVNDGGGGDGGAGGGA
jgi:hypothetical protein